MPLLSTPLLARACRIFMEAAYPDGPESIPEHKRPYLAIPDDGAIKDYLYPAPLARGICQQISDDGHTFRLGSKHYANLKLRVHCVLENGACRCVFAVDTHDAFSRENVQPPLDHPDAAGWLTLQAKNNALKHQIEAAWDAAGILTHNRLLREELEAKAPDALTSARL
jgi:hypothetical protein